jgi:hypothetical protein
MTKVLGRLGLAGLGLAIGGVAVLALMEATLSTHDRVDRSSITVVVVRAQIHGEEYSQTLEEMVEALLLTCRLEVSSDLDGEPEPHARGDGTFRVVLAPGLDDTNRRQLRGCLEDWTVDHLRVDVLRLDTV